MGKTVLPHINYISEILALNFLHLARQLSEMTLEYLFAHIECLYLKFPF